MSVPYYLAPMAAVSHRALRELIAHFGGCDHYFSEMISAAGLLNGGPLERYYLDALPQPERLVYQLVGADDDLIVRAAQMLDRRDCAGIDLNMGCSAPEIVRGGGGVGWMADAAAAARLIVKVRRVVTRRLSVKLRLGWDADLETLVGFCRHLQDAGVDLITLHPRTAREKFKRNARWEYIGPLREALRIPVAGNGDVASAEELVNRAAGPCDAVMVGRAAVRAPWIFAQARSLETAGLPASAFPETIDLEDTAHRFLDLLVRHQPAEFYPTRTRRFFDYFCENLKWSHHVKTLLAREADPAAMGRALSAYFAAYPEERYYRIPRAALNPATT